MHYIYHRDTDSHIQPHIHKHRTSINVNNSFFSREHPKLSCFSPRIDAAVVGIHDVNHLMMSFARIILNQQPLYNKE